MQDDETLTEMEDVQWEAEKRIRENFGSRIILQSLNIERERKAIEKIRGFGLEQIPKTLKIERIENWKDREFLQVIDTVVRVKMVERKTLKKKIMGLSRSTQAFV
jgi:hypothetical protein